MQKYQIIPGRYFGFLREVLTSGGERRDEKIRIDRRRELTVTVIWENRTS